MEKRQNKNECFNCYQDEIKDKVYLFLVLDALIILMNQITLKTQAETSTPVLDKKDDRKHQQNLIRDNVDKQLNEWRLKLSPYRQKQILVQQRTTRKTSKNLIASLPVCNIGTDFESTKKIQQKIHSTSNFNALNIFQKQDFNLFQNQSFTRLSFPKLLANQRYEGSRSSYHLSNKLIVVRYLTPKVETIDELAADLNRFNSISKSMLHQREQSSVKYSPQKKRIRQIVIYQKGTVMKNKK